jgi:soluble lytic murein transglycosylase-like protein
MARRPWNFGAWTLGRIGCALLIVVSAAAYARDGGGRETLAAERSSAWAIDRWSAHISEASARFQVPEGWIRRVMRAESGGRISLSGKPITSRAGAMGLMQLMPGTWAEMRSKHGLGHDPHDPRDNILAGTAYLRAMYDRFGYPGLFAAYNAGPSRYAGHLLAGTPLPSETIAYVAAVGRVSGRGFAARSRPASPVRETGLGGLFVTLTGERPASPGDASASPSNPLLVALSTALPPRR